MIAVNVLDSEDVAEYYDINHDDTNLDKEDVIGLLWAGVTKEVGYIQKDLKSSSLSYYMLKPSNLLTHGFGNNSTSQEKLFNHMCNFGARAEYREGRRVVCFYLDVKTTKDQCRLLNPTPLDCIAGYIMEDSVSDRSLKRLPQKRLNLIDGSISSYCSILNCTERLCMIKQANEFAFVLCDIEYERLGAKEDGKKRATEAEDHRKKKSEQKQMRDYEERLKGNDTFEVLVNSVFAFGMYYINNLKVKDLRVLLRYNFGSENLNGIPKKVELVGDFKYIFRKDRPNPF